MLPNIRRACDKRWIDEARKKCPKRPRCQMCRDTSDNLYLYLCFAAVTSLPFYQRFTWYHRCTTEHIYQEYKHGLLL
jgi:hypothetical protein